MSELGEVLTAYYEATGCDAAVWRRDGADETPLRWIAGTRRGQHVFRLRIAVK